MKVNQIGIIGTGNVATHLATGLYKAGLKIDFIHSRNEKEGKRLAKACSSEWVNIVPKSTNSAAVLFICTTDESIQVLIKKFSRSGYLLVHCSGSIALTKKGQGNQHYGVFYPIQSFSKTVPVDWSTTPICLEASNKESLTVLKSIATKLSKKVKVMDSADRLKVHLAAVFVNNFSNLQYIIAENLLKESHLSFDLLRPLILTTALKVQQNSAEQVQTGPARRKDLKSIRIHLNLLKEDPATQKIYRSLSNYLLHLF